MRDIPAVIYTETDRDVAIKSVEDQWHRVRFVEQREQKTTTAAADAADTAAKKRTIAAKAKADADSERIELGKRLGAARRLWPGKGPRKGDPFGLSWAAWLESIGLDRHYAKRVMELAGITDEERAASDDAHTSPADPDTSSAPLDEDEESVECSGEADATNPEATANDNAPTTPADRSGGRGKPPWLMRALVRDYSLPSDLVCDPVAGWGSTLRAALDEGRRAIGAEIDPAIAAAAGELPLRVGAWQQALADQEVDTIICDPPYSARTHEASRKFGNAREDGSSLDGLGPEYAAWTRDHVFEFVRSWSPRCRGWMVVLTDHNLIHDWQDAYEEAGRYAFAPVICLIRGMTVRLCGDGPSSWAIYAMVARPLSFSRWRTLSGGYVGSKTQLEIGDAT